MNIDLPITPALIAHISAGSVAVITGFIAIFARKGAPVHRVFGTLFFLAMLVMSGSALYMAVLKSQFSNIMGGGMALYMALTAWVTVKRPEKTAGVFELGAAIVAGIFSAGTLTLGILAANGHPELLHGAFPVAPFIMGGLLALAATLDLSVVLRHGLAGVQRIARHLWRMTFALFIAVASFAVQGSKILPPIVVHSYVLLGATLLVLVLLFFWLGRVFFTKWYTVSAPEVLTRREPS